MAIRKSMGLIDYYITTSIDPKYFHSYSSYPIDVITNISYHYTDHNETEVDLCFWGIIRADSM